MLSNGTYKRSCDQKRKDPMEKSIEELIYEETDKRLKEMQAPGYEFPPKATKADYLGIVLAIGASLLLIVLCMTGVIQ